MAGQDWAKQGLCRGMHVDMTPGGRGIIVPGRDGEGRGERGDREGERERVKGRGGSPTSAETQSPDFPSSSLEDETQAQNPFLQA